MNRIFGLILLIFFINPVFAIETDFLADKINKNSVKKPDINLDYNYYNTYSVPIRLQITEDISTRDDILFEGQSLNFQVKEDVRYNGKILLRKGMIIKGKIKTIITSGMNGIPFSIELGDFEIPNVLPSKLYSKYEKRGFSKTPVALAIKWSLTCLPPLGSFTTLIKGGHAYIKTTDKITIYYYPDWQ